MEIWKKNLIYVWFGCFFAGVAISQILPFLPLYISELGIHSHQQMVIWSGLTFSITFIISAIVAPIWGNLADIKGRKLMLLRASLGMAIVIFLQAFVSNIWQLFLLRAVMGLTSGYIPNASALVASQTPREKSGWALSILATASISGLIIGPLLGGAIADYIGVRQVFFVTAFLLMMSFFITLFFIKEDKTYLQIKSKPNKKSKNQELIPNKMFIFSLCATTMVIQLSNGSVAPILTLFVQSMVPHSGNIAFLSGVIAALPGVSALIAAPLLGKLGDKIGTYKVLTANLFITAVLLFLMSFVTSPLQLGVLRFLLGFADGSMLPAVQALLLKFATKQNTGKIFGYNQSFMYLGNVVGPLVGASVSAVAGFHWVFAITALIVLVNIVQSKWIFHKQQNI